MSGIFGYIGSEPAQPFLLEGLRALEYRGSDSTGICLLNRGKLKTWKTAGRLSTLRAMLPVKPLASTLGIGHCRWATHGEVSDINAHPHSDANNNIALVHNGIIENASDLKDELTHKGVTFQTDTDTEVLAHLIATDTDSSLTQRVTNALSQIRGTYGILVIDVNEPDKIVAACNGSPLTIGMGTDITLIASDPAALARHANKYSALQDGDVATITRSGITVASRDNTLRELEIVELPNDQSSGAERFMLQEITEQPLSIARSLGGRLDQQFNTAHLGGLNLTAKDLAEITRVKVLGCGSAYNAGRVGALMIESLARLPADAEPAAEFRCRHPVIDRNTLYIVVSQSGETRDTLEALREVRRKGARTLGIVNTVGSTIAQEVDGGMYLHAGHELSVTSTKTWSCTLTCFALLALHLGRIRDISPQQGMQFVSALEQLPTLVETVLASSKRIASIADDCSEARSIFFTGNTMLYPTALEGALKLKEIAYIHAEACPASELKHGALALMTADTPTVALVQSNALPDQTINQLQSIRERQSPLFVISDADMSGIEKLTNHHLQIPPSDPLLHPILMGVAVQLFAYHCALTLGRNIDQPRALSKRLIHE